MTKKPEHKPAATLENVTGITIVADADAVKVSWNPVEGATKYAVKCVAYYDMDGDGNADGVDDEYREVEVEGANVPNVTIPQRSLLYDADEGGAGGPAPVKLEVDVKPMAPGKAGGKKRGTWSGTPAVWPANA